MKLLKIIFYVIIFVLLTNSGSGQTNLYHHFPDSAFWRVDAKVWDKYTGCTEKYYYHYYLSGDTIINGSHHKKLFRSHVIINNQCGGPPGYIWPWATFEGYRGALKEDPDANKVFFVFPNHNNDTLLFDYNLIQGDTINGYITSYCIMTITSIDSVLVGNEYRKKWNFSTCDEGTGYIIQGVGSDNGLVEWINTMGFTLTHLICVIDSNITLYNSGFDSEIGCQLVTSIEDIAKSSNHIKIFPNPFSIRTVLQTDILLNDATLILENYYGQTIKEIKNINGQSIVLTRDNLPSGIYFVRLIQECKVISIFKIIITD